MAGDAVRGIARDYLLGGGVVVGVEMRAARDKRELTERNQRMLAMRDANKTFKQIACEFKISEPRVYLIVTREKMRLSMPFEKDSEDQFERLPPTHYTYQITDPKTGRFYFGVRTCCGNPLNDVTYMGSGRWPRRMLRQGRFLVKTIMAEYATRDEAERAERALIVQNARHKNCMNSNGSWRIHLNEPTSASLT